MSDDLVLHGSPTLAGIKTGNLFGVTYQNKQQLQTDILSFNRLGTAKGVRMVPFVNRAGKVLIYVYRPHRLSRDLSDSRAQNLLKQCGYPCKNTGACVATLGKRIKESSGFPHEIGLFLGYPPEDVFGFIENRAENFKMTGYWKVYGDEQHAMQEFKRFRDCSERYLKSWNNNRNLEALIVCETEAAL